MSRIWVNQISSLGYVLIMRISIVIFLLIIHIDIVPGNGIVLRHKLPYGFVWNLSFFFITFETSSIGNILIRIKLIHSDLSPDLHRIWPKKVISVYKKTYEKSIQNAGLFLFLPFSFRDIKRYHDFFGWEFSYFFILFFLRKKTLIVCIYTSPYSGKCWL